MTNDTESGFTSGNQEILGPAHTPPYTPPYMPPTGPAPRRRPLLKIVLSSLLAGGLAVAGLIYYFNPQAFAMAGNSDNAAAKSQTGQLADYQVTSTAALLGPNTIRDIVAKTGPAVVKVETEVTTTSRSSNPMLNDPFFRQFFGNQDLTPQAESVQTGVGSGFIISKDGYILTNEHVVDGADKISVSVSGYDKPFTAKLVGSDYNKDLALLKITASKELPTLALGKSDNIAVGDWVIAIGNPYGLDHTVTVGVISAKGRPVDIEDRQYENLLQTDASINPGNSGGPLLNLAGEVVGINTAVNSSAQGIGFAIPSSTVESIINSLKTEGIVSKPWLGVSLQPVTQELAQYFGLSKAEGAIISDVVSGGPAAKAGLQRGDIILEFNKQSIKTSDDLVKAVGKTKVGDKVTMVVFRNGKSEYVQATITAKQNGR